MKFIITFIAGLLSGSFLTASFISKNPTGIFLAVILFLVSLIFCHKYHKQKSKKFWDTINK